MLRCISIGDRPTADCGGVHQQVQHVVRINDDAVGGVVPLAVDDVDLHVGRVQWRQRDRCVGVDVAIDEDVGVAVQSERGDDHVDQLVLRMLVAVVHPLWNGRRFGAFADVANATKRQRCDRVCDQ